MIGVMADWPKLNPHSQLVMDWGKGGLVNLLRAMPEADYGAGS